MRRQYQPKFEYVAKEQQEPPPPEQPVQNQKYQKKPYKKNYKKQIDPDYQRDDEQFDITKIKQKELTQTLIQVLKQKKIECMICINKLQHEASIWSCKQCYQPFHLSCIHKWIKNINPNPQNLFNWSCPKCNFQYQEKLPDYLCFCGKTKNPDTDKYSIPHSCQQKCQKKRGNYCPHPCPLDCHPGPCPECHVKDLVIKCHCGKSQQEKSCSDNTNSFFCNQKCSKILNCGAHECQKNCHQGNCDPCLATKNIKCFCQTKEEQVLCSVKGLSCGQKCNKILDCGNHQCLENCHEECKPCQFNIAVVKTCPCGKVPIAQLIDRKSCLDPIPSCGQIQEAILQCGHKAKSICGQPFPICVAKIKQKCRCQATERVTTCDNKEQFICETVCKKKKSCKVHGCNMQCCPPNQDQLGGHLCLKVCNKPLKCGKHNCELFCHLGGCQNCPIVINQPIKCPCGKQVLNPPQRCGTEVPICFETCQKVMACGHKCQNKCHPDECPPCQEKVDKLCRCERHTISVGCYKIAICYDLCNKILKCGHKCQETCQITKECPANLEQNCGQKCQAKRTCGHNCQETCHPDQPCPKLPCKTQMRVVCVCGNRDAFIECDAIDEPIERQLKCDQKCLNIKRFGAFYKTNNLVDIEKSYYPDVLLKYANYNLDALKKLEVAIEKYLIESTPEERYDFSIQRNDWGELKKLALQILFSRHYKFEVQILRPYKNQYNISLIKTSDTIIPKVKLSEYYVKVQKGTIKRDHSPFKAKLTTVYDSLPMQDLQQFETFLFDFKNDYYIERQQNLLVINFWEIQQAEAVQKKLKRTVGLINVQWNLVINAQAVEEDDRVKAKTIEGDIIIKNKSQKPIQFYQDEDFIVQYTKQREQEFIDMRLNYHDVARLTKMCDNEEIERRIKESQLSIFEQDSFYQYECIPKRDRMIREYCRIPKEPTPEYLRTPDTLIKTIDFLLYNFIDADIKEKDVKKPMDGDKIRSLKYEDIWEYINDRLLQVRYELTQIGYTIPFIKLIKFYVMSHSQLSDSRDNLKQLSILLSEFKNKQTYKFNLILECFGNTDINIIQAETAQLELQDDLEIQQYLDLVIQVRSGQIDKFLLYYDQTDDDLVASLMHGFIFHIRQKLFDIILQSHINIAITDFVDRLKLTDWEETIDFLKDYGIENKKVKQEIEQYRKWQAAKEEDSDNELPEPPIPIIQLQKPTLEPKQFYPLDIDRTLVYK